MKSFYHYFLFVLLTSVLLFTVSSFAQKKQPSQDIIRQAEEMLKNYKVPERTKQQEVETPRQSWERYYREGKNFTNKPVPKQEQKTSPSPSQYVGKQGNKQLIETLQRKADASTPEMMKKELEEKLQRGEVKNLRSFSIEEQKKQLQEKIEKGEQKDMRAFSLEKENRERAELRKTQHDGAITGPKSLNKPNRTTYENGWKPLSPSSDISNFMIVRNADMVSAGYGGMRGIGTGTLTLSGVSGTILKAFLYWSGPTNSYDPNVNANVLFDSNAITGTNIGFSDDNCWDYTNSQAYRADVTSFVTGDGEYALGGFLQSNADINGVSLIVFFDDGNSENNRDFVLFDGNDSNISNAYDENGWNVILSGVNYTSGNANLILHVGDGQTWDDDNLYLNGEILASGPEVFDGNTLPNGSSAGNTNGGLWDIRSFDITSFMSPGVNNFALTTSDYDDCLGLVVAVVDLPAGSAPLEFGTAKIQGMKFNDLDNDSTKGESDPTLQGWTIYLHQGDSLVGSTTTDPNGNYTFASLLPGTYTVSELQKSGWLQNVPAFPGTYTVTVDSGQIVTGQDFGNYKDVSNYFTGIKFHDLNANGIKDEGEPGLAGWTINVWSFYNGEHWFSITDSNGYYIIAIKSEPDYYKVDETEQDGWIQTTDDWGWYWLEANGDTIRVDFGNRQPHPNYFTGMKFHDLNHDGIKDIGEPGLPGWTINISGYYYSGYWTDTTDENGLYFIQAGAHQEYYFISEVQQEGWYQTTSNGSYVYRTGLGDTLNFDFGNWFVTPGSISGMKFHDLNNNGVKDEGEQGLEGWVISAYNESSEELFVDTTDANGYYSFENLPGLGYYTVEEQPQLDWVQTFPGENYYFELLGDSLTELDFGNYLQPPSGPLRVNTMPSNAVNANYGNALAGAPLDVWGNVHGGVVPLHYVLDYGDGTVDSGVVTYRKYIGDKHPYTTAGYYTMTLTVRDNTGAVDVDQSVIRVFGGSTPEIQRNMAIEKGLLYNYLNQYADGHFTGQDNVAATGVSVLSFEENLHLASNDINTDIYAEYVSLGLEFLLDAVSTYTISSQLAGNPDSDSDGLGAYFSSEVYANGIVGLSIIGAHPSAVSAQSDTILNGIYSGQTYYDLVVDLLDQIAFSQGDTNEYGRGGWRYCVQCPSYGSSDNSAVQWHSLVIEAAEKLWGMSIQPFVKTELLHWLQYSQDGTGGFGYTDPGNWNNVAKTGSGIGSYAALDVPSSSTAVTNAISFLDTYWGTDNIGNLYAMYAVKKGMSIIDGRSGISSTGSHNWEDEYNSYLISAQASTGSFPDNYWLGGPDVLTTSFGVLILTPGVSQLTPVAVIAPVSSKPPSTSFVVDGSGSHHRDPNKSVVEYRWDWNASNGIDWNSPDAVGANPTNPGYAEEGTYTITLRVKDNSEPPLYDYDTKQVVVQSDNNPPVAVPIPPDRGPNYAARVGEPVLLDARASYDPDFPLDSVVAYAWDTDGDGAYDDGTSDTITVIFYSEYNGQVGLKVYDSHGASSINVAYINIYASRKDIYVESFSVSPSFGAPGDTLDFFAVFRNDATSNVDAMNVLVRFYDENPLTTGNPLGGNYTVNLPVGLSDTVAVQLVLPSLPNGSRNLYVYLDATANVAEWNEINNFASSPFSIGTTSSIEGYKFEDANGNGVKDEGDPVLPGWVIYLEGAVEESTMTDETGKYVFGNLSPGTYVVSENKKDGWVQTKPNDPEEYTIDVSAGHVYDGYDFGNFQLAGVSGMKFNDKRKAPSPKKENWKLCRHIFRSSRTM